MEFLICLAFCCCLVSYLCFDPMKSSFFLVFCLLLSLPFVSCLVCVWFGYFICLVFLSGIFVILVYFASLFKVSGVSSFFVKMFCLLGLGFCFPGVLWEFGGNMLVGLYYDVCGVVFVWIVGVLLFFMNFVSYFLGWGGALRSI